MSRDDPSDVEKRHALLRIFVDGHERYGAMFAYPGAVPLVGDEVEIEESTEIGSRLTLCSVLRRRHYWSATVPGTHETWDGKWVNEIDDSATCICVYLKTIRP